MYPFSTITALNTPPSPLAICTLVGHLHFMERVSTTHLPHNHITMPKEITYSYYLEVSDQYSIVFTSGDFRKILPILFDRHSGTAFNVRLYGHHFPQTIFFDGDIEVFQLSPKLLFLRTGKNHYKTCDEFRSTVEEYSQAADFDSLQKEKFDGYRLLYQKMKRSKQSSVVSSTRQLKPLSMYARGLDVVIKDRPTDFTITSDDSGSFQVHSFLLTNLWPFFSTASTVEMIEKDTQTLHLPFPKTCVEILVAFFYGKDVEPVSWDTSLSLLKMSGLYDIPELKKFATDAILNSTEVLTLATALKAWKTANESDASEVETSMVLFLKNHASEIEDSEESKNLTESQLLELLLQVVRV